MKGGDKIYLNEASIVIENIDLEFTLYDSGIKPIARTLLGPLGKATGNHRLSRL